MRTLFILYTCFLFTLSTSLYSMEKEEARHLLTRTGFGASETEIAYFTTLGYEEAVDFILGQLRVQSTTPPPLLWWPSKFVFASIDAYNNGEPLELTEEEQNQLKAVKRQAKQNLRGWWAQEMAVTDSPLSEKLTLFWHNHFVSELNKINEPFIMGQQNKLLRKHCFGNFKTFVHDIAKDPAMIVYLDTNDNREGVANENFARELMELFTLGEGKGYTEEDIKQAARAFTGWKFRYNAEMIGQDEYTLWTEFYVNENQHDSGIKKFMGLEDNFSGEDIIDIIFIKHPDLVAKHLVTKLYKEFISYDIDQTVINTLAAKFISYNFEIKPLLKDIFMSQAFRSESNYGKLIKSPIEYFVGMIKVFESDYEEFIKVFAASTSLGQKLFDPPNVKGWPGGTRWIDSSSLMARQASFVVILKNGHLDEFITSHQSSTLEEITEHLLPLTPTEPITGTKIKEVLMNIAKDPVFQLK